MNNDISSLAHSKWNCKYHIVFAPKYRRQVIYGKIKADIGVILRKLCEQKGVEIIEANACKDHIHMLEKVLKKLLKQVSLQVSLYLVYQLTYTMVLTMKSIHQKWHSTLPDLWHSRKLCRRLILFSLSLS